MLMVKSGHGDIRALAIKTKPSIEAVRRFEDGCEVGCGRWLADHDVQHRYRVETVPAVVACNIARYAPTCSRASAARPATALSGRCPAVGTMLDVVSVAVRSGGLLIVLAAMCLKQPRRSAVALAVTRPDGFRVKITAGRLRSVEELERILRDRLRADAKR
jgi:membrane-associated two-gene conflict system component 1 (EACC1)